MIGGKGLCKGLLVVVPYDSDPDGYPGEFSGESMDWAVVIGAVFKVGDGSGGDDDGDVDRPLAAESAPRRQIGKLVVDNFIPKGGFLLQCTHGEA